ncbi:MAG: hypothetical protein II967_01430 [Deltaproteobacteria bacterium]|jgi:hypothetical protein|nr:hypothetical protein [Deltaproteobacteria bacterium]MBQ7249131.1 hypothetical protein [Deltaproteobacteria bacterium]MBR5347318.1 hypothetical protein [Deltaproteobacteria bacterium]
MEKVKMPNGTEVAFEGAEWYMDNELRAELICDYGGVSDQEFINIYCQKHKERFGEEFSIETGKEREIAAYEQSQKEKEEKEKKA